MAELARRLVSGHGLASTVVTFTDLSAPDAHSAVLASLRDAGVARPSDDLPADTPIETLLLELIGRSIPHLRALLRNIAASKSNPLTALVPDFFCSVALPLAAELGVPGYIFFPSNLNRPQRHVSRRGDQRRRRRRRVLRPAGPAPDSRARVTAP
jgi:hydroquinone glucosyltransferase